MLSAENVGRKRAPSVDHGLLSEFKMLDVTRCFFVTHQPQPIQDMTYDANTCLCAVARKMGIIDIYNTITWTPFLQIPGYSNYDIRRIHFHQSGLSLQTLNIITVSLNGLLLQWSLDTLAPSNKVDLSQPIWDSDIKKNLIALALDDGSSKMLSIFDNYSIKYFLPKRNAKCLAICFSKFSTKTVFCGYSDGLVSKYMYKRKECIISISYSNSKLSIWRVIELSQTEIVCSDSNGVVRIWDASHGISIFENKQSEYDVLTLCYHSGMVYASGIDSKICAYQRQPNGDWIVSSYIRGQSHDIHSILFIEDTLISGGINTDICLYPIKEGRFKDQGNGIISD